MQQRLGLHLAAEMDVEEHMLRRRNSWQLLQQAADAAALRAAEINADVIFKATNVDGVYDKDPNRFADAVKYDELTHTEVLAKGLKVMDSTAASLCRDNNIPILVFNLNDPENIIRAAAGEKIGTLVK